MVHWDIKLSGDGESSSLIAEGTVVYYLADQAQTGRFC